jgi:hypothetical protein
MDSALSNALKRKKELEEELEKVNQFIDMYPRFAGTESESPDSSSHMPRKRIERVRLRRRIRTRPGEFVRIIEAILKDVRRPLPRGQLVAEIEKREHAIPTAGDKAQYLATILWRNKGHFENIEGRGYWLKGHPVPPVLP